MKEIKNENYVTIQGFMINELNLKGNELLIYAIIYGFTQLDTQEFKGSLQYLADWCNSTKQGVIKALKSLIEKGLIKKQEMIFNNVKFVSYYATKFNGIQQSLTGYSTKFNGGIKQSLTGGIQQSLPNNININNIDNNINNNIPSNPYKGKSEYDEKFEKFWKAYPRKENKKNSYKIFSKLNIDDEILKKILDNIDYNTRYNEQWGNPRFIPMPSTYLNGRRWEDELDNNNYSSSNDNGGFDTLDDYYKNKNNNCGLTEI